MQPGSPPLHVAFPAGPVRRSGPATPASRVLLGGLALLLAGCAAAPGAAVPDAGSRAAAAYDVVILGGRVIDPESGLDAVRNVGVAGGVVRTITDAPIDGRTRIDASGLVVAPGFIDLHQHGHTPEALRAKVQDGVTAAFEMEMGVPDIDAWYQQIEGSAPIHFGAAAGHMYHRVSVLTGSEPSWDFPSGEGTTRPATPAEIEAIRQRVEVELRRGALGVGMGIEYTPGATPWEVLEMFRAAARFPGAPVHVHVRGTEPPHHWMETAELVLGSVTTGAPLHIVHANSSFGSDAPKLFEMIASARARGLDVTTEAYPYTASMTSIRAAPFDDWQTWPDERFARYIWPPTGERLTRESFGRYREQGGVVVIEGMTEERLRPALSNPLTIVASDGVLVEGSAHPRLAGTYARILGRYVRDEGLLSLTDALRKMTIMPAQRLEARAPAMRHKGRLRVGADADITIFDPATVIDRATYAEPLLPSAGIVHVLVMGEPVVRAGRFVEGSRRGRAVRGPLSPDATGSPQDSGLSIRNVTVVDVESGRLLADRTVLVDPAADRILAVDSGAVAPPPGTRVIDGGGAYVIPGLWDMHVHAARAGRAPRFWPLFLAHGVTGIRETGSFSDSLVYWRAAARRDPAAAPRVVWSSPMLDGEPPLYDHAIRIATREQARVAVAAMDSLDFDYLKIYSGLSRESFLAIADEARRRRIPIAGEVPNGVAPREAAEAGLRSFEHLWNLFEWCVPGAPALRDSLAALDRRDAPAAERQPVQERQWRRWLEGYDAACADTLARDLRRTDTWQVPTLVINRSYSFPDSTWGSADERASTPAAMVAEWEAGRQELLAEYGALGAAAWRARWQHEHDMLRRMHAAGVGIMAGSDASDEPFVYPGAGLHEELALLVASGLTTLQALQAATRNPARFLGADTLGAVASGRVADLVLLDANPLADIRNTARIRAVVHRGRYLDRSALDALLARARRLAGAS